MIAAKAKEKQCGGQGGILLPQNSAKAIETRKELSKLAGVSHDTISRIEKIAAKAKENQQVFKGNQHVAIPANSPTKQIETRKELSKLAGIGSNTISRIEKIAAKAKENQGQRTDLTSGRILPNVETRKELSKLAGVSHDTISRIEKIAAKAKEKQLSTLTQFAVPQNSAKREQIETRKELSKLAGVSH